MLTDYWVIAQFCAEFCAWFLVMVATVRAIPLLRGWNADSSCEAQIRLEREGYLISTILRLIVSFQLLSLVFFLITVNHRLPQLVRGAMCATGTLGLNAFGYPLLYLKIFSIFIYIIFLALHYFDNAEPAYPLSPLKYYVVPPIFLVLSLNLVLLFYYFSAINPDLIATCCSVVFMTKRPKTGFVFQSEFLEAAFYLHGILFVCLMVLFLFFTKQSWLKLVLSVAYVFVAVYTLKYYFVKYIYGVLAHYCLFDLFLSQHYFIGYFIFGTYYILIISNLFQLIYHLSRNRLKSSHEKLLKKIRIFTVLSLLLSILIPLFFWAKWDGYL